MPPGAFRQLAARIIKHGRQVFEGFVIQGPANKIGPKAADLRINNGPKLLKTTVNGRGTSWITKKYGLRPYLGPLAAEIRRSAGQNLLGGTAGIASRGATGARWFTTSGRLSLYALLGVGFVGLGSDEEAELEKGYDNVCANIRTIFAGKQVQAQEKTQSQVFRGQEFRLEDLEIGSLVAIGSNSAVYAARMQGQAYDDDSDISVASIDDLDSEGEEEEEENSDEEYSVIDEEEDFSINNKEIDCGRTESDITILSHVPSYVTNGQEQDIYNLHIDNFCGISSPSYPLAVKMLFNYHGTSRASDIFHQMEAELVPCASQGGSTGMLRWENGHLAKKKRLPPHPNIITIHKSFVEEMPLLPEGLLHYPMALPTRLNPDGCGRNRTLFLVMDRYEFTLEQYLRTNALTLRESLLLLAQLTEAVAHINSNEVAHRDLKTDNIMLEETEAGCRLILTDFGSCLADETHGLVVPYISRWMSKGGNPRLMAPEIASATPGFNSWLDYWKSDLWAVGAIAYELFGNANPFYQLDSRTYEEHDVPNVEGVPVIISELVKSMVSKDPSERPDAKVVATAIQLLLWLPEEWLLKLSCDGTVPHKVALMRWLTTFSATLLCCRETVDTKNTDIERELQSTFLTRVHYSEIKDACQFLSLLCLS